MSSLAFPFTPSVCILNCGTGYHSDAFIFGQLTRIFVIYEIPRHETLSIPMAREISPLHVSYLTVFPSIYCEIISGPSCLFLRWVNGLVLWTGDVWSRMKYDWNEGFSQAESRSGHGKTSSYLLHSYTLFARVELDSLLSQSFVMGYNM